MRAPARSSAPEDAGFRQDVAVRSADADRRPYSGRGRRTQTLDVLQSPHGTRAELRLALPDLRLAVRFRIRGLIIPDSVQFEIDPDSVRLLREFQRGDVTGDNDVSMTDGINVLQFLFDRSDSDASAFCQSAADTNDDGEVILTDAMGIFQFLYLGGKPLAPPFEMPGHDDTIGDDLQCTPQQTLRTHQVGLLARRILSECDKFVHDEEFNIEHPLNKRVAQRIKALGAKLNGDYPDSPALERVTEALSFYGMEL